jgi:hypothetical protein
MTYFEAEEIYTDFSVNLQYKDLDGKSNAEVLVEYVHKYGAEKIRNAVKVLLNHLDEERKTYLRFLNLVESVKRMEVKHE